MGAGASDSLPEVEIPRSRDLEPTTIPQTQATGDAHHILTQPSLSSGIPPTTSPHPNVTLYDTSAVPGDASRRGYQPIPRDNLSNVVPNKIQGGERRPQFPGFAPVKVRPPREADRSRLAKDLLKQLGKPNGSVPAVPTRREYKQRKKAKAETKGTSTHISTEPMPMGQPQLVLNGDGAPLLSDPVPSQVEPSTLPTNPLQENTPSESLSLGYPGQHRESAPPAADDIEQDVDMDIQSSSDPPVSQPSGSSRPAPPQDLTPSMVGRKPAQDEGERFAITSEPQSPRWIGPPPHAEVIEISDDEGQPVVGAVVATVEPMDVDGEVGTGGAISNILSLGDDTPAAVEMGEGLTEEPLDRRSSQEPVVSKDIQFTRKKSQKVQPYVEVPPLPDYVRQIKGKERAPVEVEDEEGLYRASIRRNW